jgi:hypothetical protein
MRQTEGADVSDEVNRASQVWRKSNCKRPCVWKLQGTDFFWTPSHGIQTFRITIGSQLPDAMRTSYLKNGANHLDNRYQIPKLGRRLNIRYLPRK